jgi:hypothetical protein
MSGSKDCIGCTTIKCQLNIIITKKSDICPCSICLVKGICQEYCEIIMGFIRKLKYHNTALIYMNGKVIRIILRGSKKIIYIYKNRGSARLLSILSGDGNNDIIINFNAIKNKYQEE